MAEEKSLLVVYFHRCQDSLILDLSRVLRLEKGLARLK